MELKCEYKMNYPPKEAYVFTTPLKYSFPWQHPDYKEFKFAGKKRDEIDFDIKYDEEE